jgi:hypothetical protein
MANASFGSTASPVLRTEPVPVSAVPAGTDFRSLWREQADRRQAAELVNISLRMDALSLAWAMQGLCKRAEIAGVDVAYYRDLAAEIDGRLR